MITTHLNILDTNTNKHTDPFHHINNQHQHNTSEILKS